MDKKARERQVKMEEHPTALGALKASTKKHEMAKKMKSKNPSGYTNPYSNKVPLRSRTSEAAAGGVNK